MSVSVYLSDVITRGEHHSSIYGIPHPYFPVLEVEAHIVSATSKFSNQT